jgi:hypothetical protein
MEFTSEQAMRDFARHRAAQGKMQAGVAFDKTQDQSQKHERVGINTALCDHSALVKLLISKGIITQEEYAKAIADEMEAEVKRYEQKLSEQKGGVKITLGGTIG